MTARSVLELALRTRPGGGGRTERQFYDLVVDGEWEPIMVCPECGEEECGAIVARINARRGLVTWHAFAWYDGDRVDPEPSGTDALLFEFRAYRQALTLPLQASGMGHP